VRARRQAAIRSAARLEITAAAADRMAAWRRARTGLVTDALAKLSEEDIAAIGQALPALEKLMGILKEQP